MAFRYFIRLSYNGVNFHGWQVQENAISVQGEVNKALSLILNREVDVVGCGRTDTGVHARNFVAHFDLDTSIADEKQLVYKLNKFLKQDIVIHNIKPVDKNAHARFSAISRTYHYFISREKDPFNDDFSWYIYGDLDISLMNKGAELLKKYEDFTSFSKLHTQVNNNNCKIIEAYWKEEGNKLIFTITANRFLRNMVRAIVGTLVDLGKNKISLKDFRNIIETRNRNEAGLSVPAKGLFLSEVKYPTELFISESIK
jgi:tRNA pseudouridine38-40 synthase